jgi:hypothetical protein
VKRLVVIRDELLRDSVDARTVAAELGEFAQDTDAFEWNAIDWTAPERKRPLLWLENARYVIEHNARALEQTEQRVRDALVADSSVIGVAANLRIQRQLAVFTLVALVVAVASLIVSLT